ncbi:MAG: hypothetical protein U1F15_15360 [Burkholderiales bacterium]
MPLSENELDSVRRRVFAMFMDTIGSLELIARNADAIYGENAAQMRSAIDEYLDDFVRNTKTSGEDHPETLIFRTSRTNLQRAGLYGSQLDVKERHVREANATLRERIAGGLLRAGSGWFRKWIDVINNFLGSLVGASGLAEAIKELKDCLRDELPD